MKYEKDFFEDKETKKLAIDLILSFLETAVIHKRISLEDLKSKELKDFKEILLKLIKDGSDTKGDVRFAISYTEQISKEANALKQKGAFRLALILYATEIEHHLNDIIQKALLGKNFKTSEIESIMRLDIEAKRTWLFPLLGLPRLSTNCSKNIKLIADKRNEFIHYKWRGLFDSESQKLDKQYVELCNKAIFVISNIKRYTTNNLITQNKIKKILKNKKQKNKV